MKNILAFPYSTLKYEIVSVFKAVINNKAKKIQVNVFKCPTKISIIAKIIKLMLM